MSRSCAFLAVCTLLMMSIAASSPAAEVWFKTYGEGLDDMASDALLLEDGGLLCSGWQETDLYTWGDNFLLAQLDSSGTLLWQDATAGSSHNLHARTFPQPDGSAIIAGAVGERGNAFRRMLVMIKPDGSAS